jgi:Tfp pilus assembly protein PilF
MKFNPVVVLAAAMMVGGALASAPALAQKKKDQAAQPAQWAPKYGKQDIKALQAIEAAVKAQDWAAAQAAVTAAQATVTSPDAKYYLGQVLLQAGGSTKNPQLQAQGLDLMIASGGGDPATAAILHKNRGMVAVLAKDYARAEQAYDRWLQLAPNDPEAPMSVAELKLRQKKPQEALALTERAIAARQASGQPVPENWYLLAMQSALDADATPKTLALSKTVLRTYPNAKNWRNGLLLYRQSFEQDPATRLDTMRLMRAAKALDRDAEYLSLADSLSRGKFYAEAKAVIEEGYASGKVQRSNATATQILSSVSGRIAEDRAVLPGLEAKARASGTAALNVADGYYGHGDYAKAVEFYQIALQKGGVDANVVNTRLGMALANAGRKAEAEAAFKAVTGPRAELAAYWLLWLNQRA